MLPCMHRTQVSDVWGSLPRACSHLGHMSEGLALQTPLLGEPVSCGRGGEGRGGEGRGGEGRGGEREGRVASHKCSHKCSLKAHLHTVARFTDVVSCSVV